MSESRVHGGDLSANVPLQERLFHVLHDPIILNPADYSRGRIAPPTPLDPDGVFMARNGWDEQIGRHTDTPYDYPFRIFALDSAMRQIAFEKQTGLITDGVAEFLQAEAVVQIDNRADHNVVSLALLAQALEMRPPKDNTMLDIIFRARAGMATLPEQVRLIKEYPEVLSIETSNTRNIPTRAESYDHVRDALQMAAYLKKNFSDALVTVGSITPPTVSYSDYIKGIMVKKTVIASILSQDSHTELVMKEPAYELNGKKWPMGVTTYLRVYDRHERPGYHKEDEELLERISQLPAEQARRLMGELANKAQ